MVDIENFQLPFTTGLFWMRMEEVISFTFLETFWHLEKEELDNEDPDVEFMRINCECRMVLTSATAS